MYCMGFLSHQKINPNANVIVAPSDHLILKEEEFKEAIIKGLEFVSHSPQLLTLGIKPNRPETGYGYIQIDEENKEISLKLKPLLRNRNWSLPRYSSKVESFTGIPEFSFGISIQLSMPLTK